MSASQPSSARSAALGAPGGLATAVQDFDIFGHSNRDPSLALARVKAAGASAMRVTLSWRQVAPAGAQKPLGFVAKNPLDPAYRWAAVDRELQLVTAHGLEPIVVVDGAPDWAEGSASGPPGTRRPSAAELGAFAEAAAVRYSGRLPGLPRVRYWQVWNEPNLGAFLNPQVVGGQEVAPVLYRALVNKFAAAVHGAQPDALVIAGGNSAFGGQGTPIASIPPLEFMRKLLCMSKGAHPHAKCKARTSFDIWAHHPYTAGGPSHHAYYPDNVSLGDLPEMQTLLRAAVRARHVASARSPLFWATEFSWDTSPPDQYGVPSRLQARWVAEAMYRMWRSGISLVTWFQLRDQPLSQSIFQSGLYFDDGSKYKLDEPKPGLAAFRFPFVAFKSGRRVLVWGRVPDAGITRVAVQQTIGRGWVTAAFLRTNRFGIFRGLLRAPFYGRFRATAPGRNVSLAFALARPGPYRIISPFGR